MTVVSIIEIYAVERARRYWQKKEKELPELIVNLMFAVLSDPENRKRLRELIMDQAFMEATSKTIFESLKAGIYGLLGLDKKEQNKVTDAIMSDTPVGQLINLIPENTKIGKMVRANPGIMPTVIQVIGKMFSAQPQQAVPYLSR